MKDDKKHTFRSAGWFARTDKDGFIHRSWMRPGFPEDVFDGRPVIGICNTWSELTPCNAHFRQLAEHVKRGVWEAGGFPVEFPVMSRGETNLRPTAMLFRNLVSMDVEESIRANPIDGVVLLCGCDKTTPALSWARRAAICRRSCSPAAPMLNGKFRGQDIGSGTDVWRFSEEMRAGRMSLEGFMDAQTGMSARPASATSWARPRRWRSMVEALGMGLPHNAAIPAPDSRRLTLAQLTGRRIVEMVHEDLHISQILTREAFENAIRVNGAVGGSTNAVIHLLAMAGRVGVEVTLEDWDALGRDVPTLLEPHAVRQVSDGGLLLRRRPSGGRAGARRERTAQQGGVDGQRQDHLGELSAGAELQRRRDPAVREAAARARRHRGADAAISRRTAPCSSRRRRRRISCKHRGRAVVFETIEDYHARIGDPNLDVDATCVLVLKNCGPKGYPGMAEVGNMGLPPKVLETGVTDMVRISDARMSGTAYGTVVLHVCPEAAVGGPLALVQGRRHDRARCA